MQLYIDATSLEMVVSVSGWLQAEQAKLAKAHQQLQKCEVTVLNLRAQLQKANTYAADKLQVSVHWSELLSSD